MLSSVNRKIECELQKSRQLLCWKYTFVNAIRVATYNLLRSRGETMKTLESNNVHCQAMLKKLIEKKGETLSGSITCA